jgi:glycosyltransferase involved in cell wall biosynthesis
MTISVLIAGYNCAATIRATLDSVFGQTSQADEVLVMDDGSTDDTRTILESYKPRVKVLSQPNSGVAPTRNALVARAQGDLIAFLDSDDLWHPRYLETQRRIFELHPQAAASFIAHTNFTGIVDYSWERRWVDQELSLEVFIGSDFLERHRTAPGHFVLSFSCIPRRLLQSLGNEPFKVSSIEDVYICWLLPFCGSIVFASAPHLGAYRGVEGSLSSNRLRCAGLEVGVFELLEERYSAAAPDMAKEFEIAFHSKRRTYAKILIGVGQLAAAREQLLISLKRSSSAVNSSARKSLALLAASYLPKSLQPKWPSVDRE